MEYSSSEKNPKSSKKRETDETDKEPSTGQRRSDNKLVVILREDNNRECNDENKRQVLSSSSAIAHSPNNTNPYLPSSTQLSQDNQIIRRAKKEEQTEQELSPDLLTLGENSKTIDDSHHPRAFQGSSSHHLLGKELIKSDVRRKTGRVKQGDTNSSGPAFSSSSCEDVTGNNAHHCQSNTSSGSSWLEQIQFKAHYQHFRSIDYVSVVNSAVSLDRVHVVEPSTTRDIQHIRAGEVVDLTSRGKAEQQPEQQQEQQHQQQSLCWNFPRVKLRRLFNAKSLDDILGRTSRKGTQSSESSNSIENHLRPNAHSHTNLSTNSASAGAGGGFYNGKIGPLTPQGLFGSSSETNCKNLLPGVTPIFVTTTTTPTPSSGRKSKLTVDNKSRVKGAKSDNCLHLIVSATSFCTKIGSSSVDNLDSADQQQKKNTTTVVQLPVPVSVQVKQIEERVQKQHHRRRSKQQQIPQKEQQSPDPNERLTTYPVIQQQQQSNARKKSQVSPETDEIKSVNNRRESESLPKLISPQGAVPSPYGGTNNSETDNETAMLTKERAKLVVANVGYLQRPLSPTPAPNFGSSPPPTANSFNNNVFKTSVGGPSNRIFSERNNTQWSGNVKCANSSYSYNNYNQNQFATDQLYRSMALGTSGMRPQQQERESSGRPSNDSANAFKISKPEVIPGYSSSLYQQQQQQFRHGGHNDNFPSHFSVDTQPNRGTTTAGREIMMGGRRGATRLRPTSPATIHHPEQINNNYAIMISTGQPASLPQEHQQQQHEQSRCDNTPGGRRGYSNNSRATPRTVESGIILNQDISADTETTEGMGDLQSPQYVKRTAHMFDSRYTAQVNGSSGESRRNGDGTSQRVTNQHNQPSYLSVSRSVCGYSCLSYNNGTTTSSSAITSTNTNGMSPTPYKPSRAPKSDFPISYHQTSNGHSLDSNGRENNESMLGKAETLDLENNQNDGGSYGQSRTKSNILEKIERLYGTNAVTTASLWRRPVPLLQIPSDNNSRTSTAFKTINENVVGNSSSTTTTRKGEKIIPIFLESSRKQLSRIESADGDYEDDHHHHIAEIPSSLTVKKVSGVDKVNDKLSDDLYSKHDILNSNRLQKHTNGHNGTPITALQVNLPSTGDQEKSSYVSSRKSLNEQGSFPTAASNLNPDLNIIHSQKVLSKDKSPKKVDDDDKLFESVNMGKDSFHANIDEQISVAPAQLQEKTEDSIDGESKQIFRVVSNLSSREDSEDVGWKGTGTLNISVSPLKSLQSTEGCSDDAMKENVCVASKSVEEKNGEYFLGVVQKERNKIASLIKVAENRLEALDTTSEDSPDFEFSGVILAAIGKAKLLINKKFKQFEGLCHDNIEQRKKGVTSDEPFTTKNEDLEGFWDMVHIQVDQIHSMFQDLEKGGNTPPPKISTSPKKVGAPKSSSAMSKTTAPSKSKSSGNTARDESRRKMLAERRKAMKNQMESQSANAQQSSEPEVQIFVHDTASET